MKYSLLILLLSVTAFGCDRFANSDEKQEKQERLVVISKQYSEIIYALGAQENVVAVDLSSTYPEAIKKLPTIGYHRALSAEAILATKPSLILHDNNIGPEHVVNQLEKLEIPMKTFGDYPPTLAGTDSLLQEMGAYFGKEEEAALLIEKLNQDMAQALVASQGYTKKPKVLIIHYGRASNIYLVMTSTSTAAKMIAWAGGEMAVKDERGMKQISPEVIAAANPDVILLTDFGYDRLNEGREIEKLPGVSSTRAFQEGKIYRIEEHDLVYLGPRTGENVLLIQQLIHPDEIQ